MPHWDESKRRSNLRKHGVDFALIDDFEWRRALVAEDVRRAYGERRWTAIGLIGARVFVVAFTWRLGEIRVISLRKANKREVRRYAQAL